MGSGSLPSGEDYEFHDFINDSFLARYPSGQCNFDIQIASLRMDAPAAGRLLSKSVKRNTEEIAFQSLKRSWADA